MRVCVCVCVGGGHLIYTGGVMRGPSRVYFSKFKKLCKDANFLKDRSKVIFLK